MRDELKRNLYDNYVSHHTAPRKGRPTKELWKLKALGWDHSFSKFLPSDRRIRIGDLGCGDGALIWWLQNRGYSDTCGVDISEEQIALSKELGVKNAELGDVFQFLSDNANSFDVLIMRDLLEHLTKQEIFGVLDLITKALRPGGQLTVQVPNGASPFFGATRYGDLTHEMHLHQPAYLNYLRILHLKTLVSFMPAHWTYSKVESKSII